MEDYTACVKKQPFNLTETDIINAMEERAQFSTLHNYNKQLLGHWKPVVKHWWISRGLSIFRHGVEIVLGAAIIFICWRLIAPWLPIKSTERGPHIIEAAAQDNHSRPADSQTQVARIIGYHLFGMPRTTMHRTKVPIASASEVSFTISGIIYSSIPSESIALLMQGGDTLVAHKGARLSDGDTISSIESDRVIIDHRGELQSVPLNIKKADINAHFTPAQFARSTESAQSEQPDDETASNITEPEDGASAITAGNRPVLVTPHFKSLKQLRGHNAMRRFKSARPPA